MGCKKILVFCIIFFIIGYFFGVFLPFNLVVIEISDAPISKGDYYGNIINGFVAIGTCLAVVVALFNNEIRSFFKKVSFNICLDNNEIIEDVEDIKGTKKAKRYHNSIQFYNNGNINAQNCELYVESAKFILGDTSTRLTVENEPINWNLYNNNVYIPYQGKKVLQVLEIIAPKKQSTPGGKVDTIPAKIEILGLKDIEPKKGKWEIVYCLYSTNSKPNKFKYVVDWNGEWEERQTEMKNNLKVNLEIL